MINRPFLFLSGEYKVSLPIVYSKSNWQHSMVSNYLDFDALAKDYIAYSKAIKYNPFQDVRYIENIKLCDLINDKFDDIPLGFAVETTVSCIIQ